MTSSEFNKLLDELDNVSSLQSNLFHRLHETDEEAYLKSELAVLEGPLELCYGPSGTQATRGQKMITEISDQDLIDLQELSGREEAARRGLFLLQKSLGRITQVEQTNKNLLCVLQQLREARLLELERRGRKKILDEGGTLPLDAFTARFIFGPKPGLYSCKMSQAPRERDFIFATVKSGKKVAVNKLTFNIPEIYKAWLIPQAQAIGNNISSYNYSYLPTFVGQDLSKLYFMLGFKPEPQVNVYYRIYPGWSSGFRLDYSRLVPTKDLIPAE